VNMLPCRACNNRSFCSWLKKIPYYRNFEISKTDLQVLPKCFEETPLGEPKGGLRQYRGPYGSHVHEYENTWSIHRDKVDPRLNPVGHLITDAPHVILLGSLCALAVFGVVLAIKGGEKE
jgi:hypothetical protein